MILSAGDDDDDDGDGGDGGDDDGDGDGDNGGEIWPIKFTRFDRVIDRKAALLTNSVWVIWELYNGDIGEWRGMRSMLKPIRLLLASTNIVETKKNKVSTKWCMLVERKEAKE